MPLKVVINIACTFFPLMAFFTQTFQLHEQFECSYMDLNLYNSSGVFLQNYCCWIHPGTDIQTCMQTYWKPTNKTHCFTDSDHLHQWLERDFMCSRWLTAMSGKGSSTPVTLRVRLDTMGDFLYPCCYEYKMGQTLWVCCSPPVTLHKTEWRRSRERNSSCRAAMIT